jgi:hypothetical protein
VLGFVLLVSVDCNCGYLSKTLCELPTTVKKDLLSEVVENPWEKLKVVDVDSL